MTLAAGSIRIEPLESHHDRAAFACGKEVLDRYIRQQASQDVRRGVASVFVAVMVGEPSRILGFFTLSAASVIPTDLPREVAKRMPRHPIPAALIGRLAVDLNFARQGLGGVLLADAIQKAAVAAETVAMSAVVVDPLDDDARAFYTAFGFRSLEGPQPRMFLSMPRPNS